MVACRIFCLNLAGLGIYPTFCQRMAAAKRISVQCTIRLSGFCPLTVIDRPSSFSLASTTSAGRDQARHGVLPSGGRDPIGDLAPARYCYECPLPIEGHASDYFVDDPARETGKAATR